MKKLLFILLAFAACTKEKLFTESNQLFPTGNGGEWVYVDTLYTEVPPDDELFIYPIVKKKDTLRVVFGDTISYKGHDDLIVMGGLFFGISHNGLLRVDSNKIILYNKEENKEYTLFEKVNAIDTISASTYSYTPSIYYIPYPIPDPMPEPPKLQGKQYHIAYPELTKIGKYVCYKNEHITCNREGEITRKIVLYVAPGIGVVRTQFYAVVSIGINNWGRPKLLNLYTQYDLISYKVSSVLEPLSH